MRKDPLYPGRVYLKDTPGPRRRNTQHPQPGEMWVARPVSKVAGRRVRILAVRAASVEVVNVQTRRGSSSSLKTFQRNYDCEGSS